MCGICGRVELTPRPAAQEIVARMQARMAHRGPDDYSVWTRESVALGHRRLSIIDIDGGRQPVLNEAGDIAVILNGEIYNHATLRATLASRGHRFRTRSDTEVLVHGYEEWGDAFLERLEGMFAIALWDGSRRRLLLARDRLGVKPLFVHHSAGRFLTFASELGALWCDPEIPRAPDMVAIDQYLALQYVPGPRSGAAGVEKLPAAHALVVEQSTVRMWEYWDPSSVAVLGSYPDAVDRVRGVLTEAVRSHLVSDVPVASFLSGGVDSGIVTALMARQSAEQVRAITVGFGAAALDESPQASALARRYDCRHVIASADANVGTTFDRVAGHLDEPFADWSALPTFLLSEAARSEVKVVLSGDGGDELFGGYARHRVERIESVVRALTRHLPPPVLNAMIGRYPSGLPGQASIRLLLEEPPLSIARKHAHGFFGEFGERESLYGPALRDVLARPEDRGEAFAEPFARWYERVRHRDPVTIALYLELKTYLVDDVLVKVDRMSMAHALEVRVPLLDHRLVELSLALPGAWKVGWRRGKRILRAACRDLLPRSTWRSPKRGFDIPAARWLREELRTRAADLLLDGTAAGHGLVARHAVERLWREHQLGHRDHARRLWALLMLEVWMRSFDRSVPSVSHARLALA